MVHALKVNTKGDVAATSLGSATTMSMNDAQNFFGKKTEPAIIGHYNYKTLIVYIIGYSKGRAGTENKTQLPKPYDKTVVFGDLLLVASSNRKHETETIRDLASLSRDDFKALQSEPELTADCAAADAISEDEEELPEFEDSEEEDDVVADESDTESEVELPEEEVEEAPVLKRKKKVAPTAILSGYQKQSLLIVSDGHDELHENSPSDVPQRLSCRQRFNFMESDLHIVKSVDLEPVSYTHLRAHETG
jgi:hypothetical protein